MTVPASVGARAEEAVGPVDDELVRLREPLRGHERRARVADGDAIAEQLADAGERRGMVDRSEDVHRRPRVECMDEDGLAVDLREAAVDGRSAEALPADSVARCRDGKGDGPVGLDCLRDRGDERRVERCDQDRDRAAAGEPDLERLVVGDPVLAQPSRSAVEDLLRLADHGGLDAAAGDRAGDLAHVVQRQRRAGVARGGAAPLDDGRDRGAPPVGMPASEGREDVPHGANVAARDPWLNRPRTGNTSCNRGKERSWTRIASRGT